MPEFKDIAFYFIIGVLFISFILFARYEPNPIYAEMWNYSNTNNPYQFHIETGGVYYNLTGLVPGDLKNVQFINSNNSNGGSKLIFYEPGLYKLMFSMSFSSEANGGLYGVSITHNNNVSKHRDCYSRRAAALSVGSVSVTCLMDINKYDMINIQVENENNNRDIFIHTANLNIIKIDDLN